MSKLKNFLKSKYKTEYQRWEIVPWYKGLWYYDAPKNRNVCIILPLCLPLIIIRNCWSVAKMFGMDSMRFYENQFKIREKKSGCPRCGYN